MYFLYAVFILVLSLIFAVSTYGLSLLANFVLVNWVAAIVSFDEFRN